MYPEGSTAVIIAAGGRGRRFGSDIPKQYLSIGGEPVILRTLRAFQEADGIDHIFISADSEHTGYCRKLAADSGISKVRDVVCGGAERQDSVYCSLVRIKQLCPEVSYVLVHDAARPFVTGRIISDVIETAAESGAAIACVAMKDSLRETDGTTSRCVDRNRFRSVQTPQGFDMELLTRAYDKAREDGWQGTDDASLVERLGHEITLVDGDYSNIKITTKEDLPMENRTGTGFDVHRLTEGRKLILGGVDIPHEKGLDGHSDADVLVHAVMDALLGAAGMGDIGLHFPDTDDRYKGISSMKLLEEVNNILKENFFTIGNIDVTLIAQRPKIRPYVQQMRTNIAETLGIDVSRVNIKGTTTEKLGFTGREEGIAAEAVCSIYR